MAKTDFKQIGFTAPRVDDVGIYSADINAAYGAIQTLQTALEMKVEQKEVQLSSKPYYDATTSQSYSYRYYELPIGENYFFNVEGISVLIDGTVIDSTAYKVVQNNAILLSINQTANNRVTVRGNFGNTESGKVEEIERNIGANRAEISHIKDGTTVVKKSENSDYIKDNNGNYQELKNAILNMVYPIGSIYMSASSANPSTFLGGTWQSWGSGRVPVGINTNDANFNAIEKSGGNASITLAATQLPAHTHQFQDAIYKAKPHSHTYTYYKYKLNDKNTNDATTYNNPFYTEEEKVENGGTWATTSEIYLFGRGAVLAQAGPTGQPISILPPYIVCYMWKRTA